MHRTLLPSRAAGLAFTAVVGGAVALGGAAALGKLGDKTTIIREEADLSSAAPAAFQTGRRESINQIYRSSAPGVVHIETTLRVPQQNDPFFGNPFGSTTQTERALGSGFVIDRAGDIVTNYHVVRGATSIQVSFSDNERYRARLVGTDPSTDIAVLKVHVQANALKALPLGNSDAVRVGDQVIAIGNPFGLDRSVTAGIVSAVQRRIEAPNNLSIAHVIQTDAALNHGNSGGPLLDAQGDVVGVNAQIETGGVSQGNVGIGFAIPINTVKAVVAQLIKHGKVEHAFLGIDGKTLTAPIAHLFHLPVTSGVLVATVHAGTGAASAGLKPANNQVTVEGESWPAGGDVIVKVDGEPIRTVERLIDVIASKQPGDKISVEVVRGTSHKTLTIELGRQP
ncbi:MAG TPA: trypsin-like peptidase domain-containing protein [Gaiellaceae bacterium]|nr:trypsin-like peptidase domain-containing protein [Gaiellaceae bacterium]